jgi:hypothetical protein
MHQRDPHRKSYKPVRGNDKSHIDMLSKTRKYQEYQHRPSISSTFFKANHEILPRKRRRKVCHKPPHAISQSDTPAPFFDASSMNFLGQLDRVQTTGFLFLLLIGGAYTLEVSSDLAKKPLVDKKIKPERSREEKEEKIALRSQVYQKVCTDRSKQTYNKPNVTVSLFKGSFVHFVPTACVGEDKLDCALRYLPPERLMANLDKSDRLRGQISQHVEEWRHSIKGEVEMIYTIRHTSQEEKIAFYNVMQTISDLKYFYTSSVFSRQSNGGVCDEHFHVAFIDILSQKIKYGLEMKLQLVQLSTEASYSHAYLLLDSDAQDVDIQKDPKRVKNTLDQIKHGKICDPWNHGHYTDILTDDNNLYKSDDSLLWDNLFIKSYSLNLAEFKKLSIPARAFICKQLEEMGLDVEPKGQCSEYTNQSETETGQNGVCYTARC